MNRVVPVIDLKEGQVVHAIAGERDQYRPVNSCLTEGSSPFAIAKAFRNLGFESVYVADLDAITRIGNNMPAYEEICAAGLSIWLDSAVVDAATALKAIESGIAKIVVGLESVSRPTQVADVLQAVGNSNMIVSLDMKHGVVLSQHRKWSDSQPLDVALELREIGVARVHFARP